MSWIVIALVFIVAIAILLARDRRSWRRRRRNLIRLVSAREPVEALVFARECGTSLALAEVTRIREIVAEYFQLDPNRVTAEDDVWTIYGVELADELEALMQQLRDELGFDMASYDVERIRTIGSIVRRCAEVGKVKGRPAHQDPRGSGARS